MTIKFGTEGWRAIMAEEFTADNVRLVTQAIAEHVLEQAGGKPFTVPVGHDTRFLSDYFARTVCEVLAGNGIPSVLTTGSVPTCAVSRAVVDGHHPAGIMVTASHNPGIYNGIKIKESFGGSATPETVASVERRIGGAPVKRMRYEDALEARTIRTADFVSGYLKGIRAFIDLPAIRQFRTNIVVDSMHGTGGRLIEGLLKGGRCRVTTLHPEPDPRFGGQAPEPIASHLIEQCKTVKRTKADLGIATDGDADRIGIISPDGTWLNPGQAMCVIITHIVRSRQATGAVVKTVSNTMMINRLCDALGLRLIETPVGFKYIAKLMLTDNILIGGEESGGIGVKGYLPERDGIVNGLLVLEAMATQRKKLSRIMRELEQAYGQWHYGRRDLHLTMDQVEALFQRLNQSAPADLAGVPVVKINTMDGVKLIARDDSWLLFRRSGTEPIVRIYAETPRKSHLPRLLRFGVSLTGTA